MIAAGKSGMNDSEGVCQLFLAITHQIYLHQNPLTRDAAG